MISILKLKRKRVEFKCKNEGYHLPKWFFILLLILIFSLSSVHAQMAILASGCDASDNGGSVNYSVGLVVYTANTGTGGSVEQGVQEPYEISVVTGIEDAKGITLCSSAYPNPTTNFLTLKIEGELTVKCIASLYSINGELLENKKIVGNETIISMENLLPATYFLKILSTNHDSSLHEIKTFKIIKF